MLEAKFGDAPQNDYVRRRKAILSKRTYLVDLTEISEELRHE